MITFDEKKEPAVVQIEINQRCYVKINGRTYSGQIVEEVAPSGRVIRVWKGDRVWVPPRVAERLTKPTDSIGGRAIAKVVGTRGQDDALKEVGGTQPANKDNKDKGASTMPSGRSAGTVGSADTAH